MKNNRLLIAIMMSCALLFAACGVKNTDPKPDLNKILPAPTDITMTLVKPTLITLSWKNNAITASGIQIQRNENTINGSVQRIATPTQYITIGTLAANATIYYDSTIKPNIIYNYKVLAMNSLGQSNPSPTTTNTTPTPPPVVVTPPPTTVPIDITLIYGGDSGPGSKTWMLVKVGGRTINIGCVAMKHLTFNSNKSLRMFNKPTYVDAAGKTQTCGAALDETTTWMYIWNSGATKKILYRQTNTSSNVYAYDVIELTTTSLKWVINSNGVYETWEYIAE